jgi:hypothetical protein
MANITASGALNAAAGASSYAVGWVISSPPHIAYGSAADGPATCVKTVVPSDQTVFSPPCRYLLVQTGGIVKAVMADGDYVSITVGDATRLLFSVKQVLIGTTASNIFACW